MRLLTAISIVSLVVSIAAVVFVLGLYGELEKSEPETPLVKKVYTQELNESMVTAIIRDHVRELITLAGITHDNKYEMLDVWDEIPGFNCLWGRQLLGPDKPLDLTPDVYGTDFRVISYNYIKADDIWLATSVRFQCEELTTWAIDDNTGEVTYGHPDEK